MHQAAEQQGGDPAVRIAAHVQDIAPATRDHPDPFGDVGATVTEELEGRRIQGQRSGIVPASLPAQAFRLGHRQDTRRIVETEGRARAHHEITRRHDVGRAAGVDQGAAQAAEEEVAEVLDRTGREGAADIERGSQVHDRRTGVILIPHQHRGAAAVAAADIVELVDRREDRADEQVGRITGVAVGQDVGRAGAADVERAAAGTEAVGIAGADAEGRAVISAHLTHEVVGAAEERRAVADLGEVEILRVDGVQLHLDRAGVAAEARGVGRRGEHEGAEVLGAAEAADTEVDGREREVSRDADEREGGVARTEVELAGPAGGHVGRGVELDRRSRLDEDVAAGDLGRVAERDELAGAGAEEGRSAVVDVASEERGAVAGHEEVGALLVERAVAGDHARDRRLRAEAQVGVPRHGQVAEVGIRARPAVGDGAGIHRQVRRAEGAAEGEVTEDDGLVRDALIQRLGALIQRPVVDRDVTAADEVGRGDARERADDDVVRRMRADDFVGFGAVTVVTGLEGHVVQGDLRVGSEHVDHPARAAEFDGAAAHDPRAHLAVGGLVPSMQEQRARTDLGHGAGTAGGDEIACEGHRPSGGAAELITDVEERVRLGEGDGTGEDVPEVGLGSRAAGEDDRGGIDRQVVQLRRSGARRTADGRRDVGGAEVVQGRDGEVVALARTELLGVEAGDDFDAGDRVIEVEDTAGERDGARTERQGIGDVEAALHDVGRGALRRQAGRIGAHDQAGVDGRAARVIVGADDVADADRGRDREFADARLGQADRARAVADHAGEGLGLQSSHVQGEHARRGGVVGDEAGAGEAAEGEAETVEVQRARVVHHQVDAAVGGAAGRRDGASPGEAELAFLDEERAQAGGARGGRLHDVGGAADQQVAGARLDEVGRGEIGGDRGDAALPFPHVDIGVHRRSGGAGAEDEVERSRTAEDRTGGAIEDQAAVDDLEGVRGVRAVDVRRSAQGVDAEVVDGRGGADIGGGREVGDDRDSRRSEEGSRHRVAVGLETRRGQDRGEIRVGVSRLVTDHDIGHGQRGIRDGRESREDKALRRGAQRAEVGDITRQNGQRTLVHRRTESIEREGVDHGSRGGRDRDVAAAAEHEVTQVRKGLRSRAGVGETKETTAEVDGVGREGS